MSKAVHLNPLLMYLERILLREVLCEIRKIFRYLNRNDLLQAVAGIHAPRYNRIIPVLESNEQERIKTITEDNKTPLRDTAMILLGLSTGIRACDIINLRLSDIDWRNETISWRQSKTGNVKEFVGWLSSKKYAPKTINLKLTAIRSFLKYCGDEDFELRGIYNDVCTVKKVKEEKKPIEYLQPTATKAILEAYDAKTAKHRRNRMLLILLYDTAARVQELADLKVSSLHLETANPFVTLTEYGIKLSNTPTPDPFP